MCTVLLPPDGNQIAVNKYIKCALQIPHPRHLSQKTVPYSESIVLEVLESLTKGKKNPFLSTPQTNTSIWRVKVGLHSFFTSGLNGGERSTSRAGRATLRRGDPLPI